jgi:hypothetical protein
MKSADASPWHNEKQGWLSSLTATATPKSLAKTQTRLTLPRPARLESLTYFKK